MTTRWMRSIGRYVGITALVLATASGAAQAAPQGRTRPRDSGGGQQSGGGQRSGGERSGGGAVSRRPPAPAPNPPASPAPPNPAPPTSSERPSTPERTPNGSGQSSGNAVPRGSVPRPVTRPTTIFVPSGYYGGFWPWGFGGLGFGGYYYGAFDPYFAGYGAGPYYSGYAGLADGSMRLKMKPRDAQVFVDGLYVGVVDDFDGMFQRLHLDAGPHRIEVRAAGYETLTLDVQIHPDQTIKYEGDLKKTQ